MALPSSLIDDLLNQPDELVPDVLLFGAGLHREGELPYSRADIADILRNFEALSTGPSPPLPVTIGLGHELGTDQPAVGRVQALHSRSGGTFAADMRLKAKYAEATRQGLYFRVSAEIEPNPPFGLPGTGCCLVGVALLGRTRPQLKWTGDVSRALNSEAPRRFWSERRGTRTRVYSEAVMDQTTKDTLLAVIKKTHPGLSDDFLGGLTDDQLNQLAAEVAQPADGATAAADGAAPMDRPAMEAAILAADPMKNQADLAAMSDEQIKTLYDELTAAAYAEQARRDEENAVPDPNATPPANPQPRPTPQPQPTPQPPAQPTPQPAPRPTGETANYAEALTALQRERQLAERERKLLERDRQVSAAQRAARDKADREALLYSERRDATAFVKQLVAEGKLPPAELDPGDEKNPNWTKVDEIMAHDNTRAIRHTYAEGRKTPVTARDQFKAKLAAEKPRFGGRAVYGEMLPAGQTGGRKAFFEAIQKETRERYAAASAAPEIPLETRLGMLPARHLR